MEKLGDGWVQDDMGWGWFFTWGKVRSGAPDLFAKGKSLVQVHRMNQHLPGTPNLFGRSCQIHLAQAW